MLTNDEAHLLIRAARPSALGPVLPELAEGISPDKVFPIIRYFPL